MRLHALFQLAVLAVFAYVPFAHGADNNGYTAQYECRAGGAHCNVDVASLASRACDQIIEPSAPWSTISWSNRVICLRAGDHTWKGALATGLAGSSGAHKVLRCVRGDGMPCDDPVRAAVSDRARLARLNIDHSWWLVTGLAFPEANESDRVFLRGVSDVIIDRVLVEACTSNCTSVPYSSIGSWGYTNNRITVQNSVARNRYPHPSADTAGLSFTDGSDIHIVNNEIYDWSSHTLQMGRNEGPVMAGLVVENNDIYYTPALYTNGGATMQSKAPLVIKAGGTRENPIRIMQNRVWGARWTDGSACCNGLGGGQKAISVTPRSNADGDGNNYVLIQNNIAFDSHIGLQFSIGYNYNVSIIGNLLYKIRPFYKAGSETNSHALSVFALKNSEVYLNTIVNSEQYYIDTFGRGGNEFSCNAFIGAGSVEDTSTGGNTVNWNAYYGTAVHSTGSNNQGNFSLSTRASNRPYSVGDVIRTHDAESCVTGSESACFLYRVTTAGTTAGSAPQYCTSLGCTTTDGSVTVQAVRGPYVFYRKLRTAPERYAIPYARVHASAAEAYGCPSDYDARAGVGIN